MRARDKCLMYITYYTHIYTREQERFSENQLYIMPHVYNTPRIFLIYTLYRQLTARTRSQLSNRVSLSCNLPRKASTSSCGSYIHAMEAIRRGHHGTFFFFRRRLVILYYRWAVRWRTIRAIGCGELYKHIIKHVSPGYFPSDLARSLFLCLLAFFMSCFVSHALVPSCAYYII